MFEFKPDFERVMQRFEAWWECEILDRPLCSLVYPKPESQRVSGPSRTHAACRDRWLDTQFQVESNAARLANTVWYGDGLPVAFPNLGPDIVAAFYGCPLEFGEETSWSSPILPDWEPASVAKIRIDREGFYFRKIVELTDAFIEAGRGRFLVGYTDIHTAADTVAALRDPQQLCLDTIEHPAEVKALCMRITGELLELYDFFHARLRAAGMPSTTWLRGTCRGKYHVPSNDFSCMVSEETFVDLFLEPLLEECRHMDRCIYHLDGPQALRYLDRLLEIPGIQAIQWVPSPGSEYWANWIHVYQRIQAAGKAFIFYPPYHDLPRVFETLRPEGAWISLGTVPDKDTADAILASVAAWKGR